MYDYIEQVTKYLEKNFEPCSYSIANFKRTTDGLLLFLFQSFPVGCINSYELNEILLELGYERNTWVEESVVITETNKKEKHTISKALVTGWLMKAPYNLDDDVFEYKK